MLNIIFKGRKISIKPRIDLAGYHHVINGGVNRCNVFNYTNDKNIFLQIINKTALIQKVILYDYVLIDNNYHLLLETKKENYFKS